MGEGRGNPEYDRSRPEPWQCHDSRAADVPIPESGGRDPRQRQGRILAKQRRATQVYDPHR